MQLVYGLPQACRLGTDCTDCGWHVPAPPPAPRLPQCVTRMELVFVLDESGSMSSFGTEFKALTRALAKQFEL